jgi:N-alpha-acetyltransferase 35, NatC auxiliary subunit
MEADVLQIMDSKLDSGHLQPGETLEDEYDVLRSLLPEEVLGIMDQILCHEVGSLDSRYFLGRMC